MDIGPATGWLNMRGGQTRESEEILVQVQRRRLGARKPSLSADIEIPGEYAVLIPKRQIEISHRIRNQRSRDRLHQLGKALDLDWGIIWRTAAADQSADVLRRELAELAETAQTIRATAEESGAPALLWSETNFMDVEF
ncbi:MAG: ribonuclease E/G, partial [Candidatus Hermodarchaeia archaeon]